MNDDSRLHVDPAVISGGVKATLDCVDEMSGTIRSVASAHEDLLAVWTGPASRDVEGTWSELEPAFRRHIERLGNHAQSIQTASDGFVNTDDLNGEGFLNV